MKFTKETYGKILVPMVTPFNEDQSIAWEKVEKLIDHLINSGNADSLVLSGTTGEFHTMSFDERVELLRRAKEHAGDRIPLIGGVGCTSTVETIALARKAEDLGYEAVMIVAPYYAKPNQDELLYHFTQAAASVSCNVMLYNIPIFTGVNVNPETVGRLAEIDNIVAIKEEAELNPKQMTAFLNATPDDFILYNGDDTMILECFAQGGEARIGGVISGASHLLGTDIRRMIEIFLSGDIQQAAAMQRKLYPVLKVMGQNSRINPVSLWKSALKLAGIDAGIPRRPLSPGTPEEIELVRAALQNYGAL